MRLNILTTRRPPEGRRSPGARPDTRDRFVKWGAALLLILLVSLAAPGVIAPEYRSYPPNTITLTTGTGTGGIDDLFAVDDVVYSVLEEDGDTFQVTSTADFDLGTKTDTATETELEGVAAGELQKDVYGPEGDIVIQVVGVADASVGDVADTEYWRGESFEEHYSGHLTSVLFWFDALVGSPNNVSVYLYSDDGGGLPDTELSESNNRSSNVGWSNYIGSTARFKTFTFPKPYPVTAGTRYHVILQTEGDSPTNARFVFHYDDSDVYPNGDWIQSTDGGSTWAKFVGLDMQVIVRVKDYGGEEVQATPYPVSENEQSPVSAIVGDKAYNNGGGPPTTNGWKWYEYDPGTDAFSQLANIPNGTGYPRHAGSAVGDGTYAYFIGGGKSTTEVVPYTHRYNIGTDSWTWMANMTYGVADTCAVFYENGTYDQIFMIGGINSTIDAGTKAPAPYVQIYNITDDSWHEGLNMTQYRAWICPVLINDKIYVVGGANETGGTETIVPADDVYIYDIAANTWATGTSLPRNMYRYSALNINDELYTFGGVKKDENDLPDQTVRMVWEYDPVGDSWDYTHVGINRTWGAVAMLSDGIHYFAGSQEAANGALYIETDDHFIINATSAATWESATQTMAAGDRLETVTLTHTVAADGYVDEVWAEVAGVEMARWSTDLTSGASTVLNAASLTTGDLYDVDADFTLVVVFRSDNDTTPTITAIDGVTVGYALEVSFNWVGLDHDKNPRLNVVGYKSDAETVTLQVWRMGAWLTLDADIFDTAVMASWAFDLSPSDLQGGALQVRFIDNDISDDAATTIYVDLLTVTVEVVAKPPAAPIDVHVDVSYDLWANEIVLNVQWVQTGGPEPALETGKWATVWADGVEIGTYSVHSTRRIPAPWSSFDGKDHNVTAIGAVNVVWPTWGGDQTYYSDSELETISNFPRFAVLMFGLFCLLAVVAIVAVRAIKKRRDDEGP